MADSLTESLGRCWVLSCRNGFSCELVKDGQHWQTVLMKKNHPEKDLLGTRKRIFQSDT
jgi:hypothetical protein